MNQRNHRITKLFEALGSSVKLGMSLALGATLCAIFLARFPYFELLSHFRAQYLLLGALGVVLYFRQRIFLILGLLLAALNTWPVVQWYIPASAQFSAMPTFRVMNLNVHTPNTSSTDVLQMVLRESPDVVCIQEIDSRWKTDLQPLAQKYPYSFLLPRQDNFGIGIYSRVPLITPQIVTFDELELPAIEAGLQLNSGVVQLLVVHAIPPSSRFLFRSRNEYLINLKRYVDRLGTFPLIIAGDLNVSVFSPYYADLISGTNLSECRRGFGLLPTWPAQFFPLLIPIDHIFVRGLGVQRCSTVTVPGSDHHAIVGDLSVGTVVH